MKPSTNLRTLLFSAMFCAVCGCASAQADKDVDQNQWQDKLEQQPPQSTQKQTERAIRRSDPKNAARRNDSAQAKTMKKVKERATGQSAKNPATQPPKPVLSDPVSTPLNH